MSETREAFKRAVGDLALYARDVKGLSRRKLTPELATVMLVRLRGAREALARAETALMELMNRMRLK